MLSVARARRLLEGRFGAGRLAMAMHPRFERLHQVPLDTPYAVTCSLPRATVDEDFLDEAMDCVGASMMKILPALASFDSVLWECKVVYDEPKDEFTVTCYAKPVHASQ